MRSKATHDALSNDLPEGYRMTELGPLPEGWRVVQLGKVYKIQQGKALSRKKDKGLRPRPFLRTANVLWGKLDLSALDQMDFSAEEEKKYTLSNGDLLICEGGEIGRTAIWEGQMQGVFYQNHIFRARATSREADSLFHMYWMQAAIKLLDLYLGHGNKTTIPNLSKRRLAGLPIPLPPLPEQRAIAHVLRTVQRSKEATEQVIAALKELKKSLMHHLFTYGPVPVDQTDRVEMQETEIGPLPKHWKVARLGEVANVRGGTAFPHKYQGRKRGPFPFFKVSDMNSPTNSIYMNTASNWIDHDVARTLRAKPFPRQTIIFPKVGGAVATNKKRMLVRESFLDNNLMGVSVNPQAQCFSEFLFYWFASIDLVEYSNPGPLPSITAHAIKEALIPLPPLSEQREIARILQAVDRKIEAEENRKAALEALFKSLLHDLMTARRRLPKDFVERFRENEGA